MITYEMKYKLDGKETKTTIYARDKVDALEIFVKVIRKYTDRKRNPMVLGDVIEIE